MYYAIGSRQRIKDYVNVHNLGLTLVGDVIRNHTNCRYLWVDIESYLSFEFMTHNICNKLSSRVSMLQRLSQSIPTYYLNQLYYAFVQPFLDYCILIWGHTADNNINKIQKFQNRSARIICKLYDFACSGLSLVKSNGWLNVRQRRDFLYCTLIHKCIYGIAPNYLSDHLTLYDNVQYPSIYSIIVACIFCKTFLVSEIILSVWTINMYRPMQYITTTY